MTKEFVTIDIEKLIEMAIIACGKNDGYFFEYYPKLPSCFTEKLNFTAWGNNADFLRVTANDKFGVDCWFVNKDGETFYYDLKEVRKLHPILYVSLVTHMFDVIENLETIC